MAARQIFLAAQMFMLQDKDNALEVKLATSGQFSNLNLTNYIQISNFNFLKLYPFSSNLTIFGRERWGAFAVYMKLCMKK
jgi:hypothetical protein